MTIVKHHRVRDLTVEDMVDNLLTAYDMTSQDERDQGAAWYFDANAEATRMSETYGLSVDQTAGIISALSPRCRWSRNLVAAETVCQGYEPTGFFQRSVDDAMRIRSGMPTGFVLRGPKTRSFADNIANPWLSDAVTVDYRHANQLAGRLLLGAEVKALVYRVGGYHDCTHATRMAAMRLGIPLAHQLQATVWV